MSHNVVQADYEALADIAKRFAQSAQMTQQMQSATQNVADQLRDGGWIGHGAETFFKEMSSEVTPAVQRLIDALFEAGRVTEHIRQFLKQAEEEAAQPIPGNVEETIGGLGTGVGASNGGGGLMGGGDANGNAMSDYYVPRNWLSDIEREGVFFDIDSLNDLGVPQDWLSDVKRILGKIDDGNVAGGGSRASGGATGDGFGDVMAGSDASQAESTTAESGAHDSAISQQGGNGFGSGSGIAPALSDELGGVIKSVLAYQQTGHFALGNATTGSTISAMLYPGNLSFSADASSHPRYVKIGAAMGLTLGLTAASPFVAMLGKTLFGKGKD